MLCVCSGKLLKTKKKKKNSNSDSAIIATTVAAAATTTTTANLAKKRVHLITSAVLFARHVFIIGLREWASATLDVICFDEHKNLLLAHSHTHAYHCLSYSARTSASYASHLAIISLGLQWFQCNKRTETEIQEKNSLLKIQKQKKVSKTQHVSQCSTKTNSYLNKSLLLN